MSLQEPKKQVTHTNSSAARKDIFNSGRFSSTVVKQDFFRFLRRK